MVASAGAGAACPMPAPPRPPHANAPVSCMPGSERRCSIPAECSIPSRSGQA
eukprot:NODE_32675_length_344_cov_17.580645.p4 GENE.NODE_32675_length_344_cov_17.580645~~NODE_32675_length_344_cov_17.580645.p4  ORF type:complete len:52 (-),score=7.79 NODE_32675_length_344_cov_17.580645:122-277(-)